MEAALSWILAGILVVLIYAPDDFEFVEASPVKIIEDSANVCSILINGGLKEPQPLILYPGTGNGFVRPLETGDGSILLLPGDSLRLSCLGKDNAFDIEGLESVSEANVTCVKESTFSFNDFNITEDFENIACLHYPTPTARRTGIPCGTNSELCEIGFDFGSDGFLGILHVCHNDIIHHTIFAYSKIGAVVNAHQKSFPSTKFVKGDFYNGISMANIYKKVNQREALAKILGSEELALRYIPNVGNHFLAKGHLAAKADFIYGSHQRATFYYLNTIPMWQNINAGNWEDLEKDLRSLASGANIDLDIWCGSLGFMKLPDINGVHQKFYLYVDENDNRAVPVAKLIFKVVFEPISGRGVVFVTANNPYIERLTDDYIICQDICANITYLTWKPTMQDRGLSYCCEIDDFRKNYKYIPNFKTYGILE